jgi:hypothetical protein
MHYAIVSSYQPGPSYPARSCNIRWLRLNARGGGYRQITPERQVAKDPSPLKVKAVVIEERRDVVC